MTKKERRRVKKERRRVEASYAHLTKEFSAALRILRLEESYLPMLVSLTRPWVIAAIEVGRPVTRKLILRAVAATVRPLIAVTIPTK